MNILKDCSLIPCLERDSAPKLQEKVITQNAKQIDSPDHLIPQEIIINLEV